MIDLWHLTDIDWLARLSPESAEELQQSAELKSFPPGSHIFGPDPSPSEVFILESGLIRIYRESPDAVEVTFGYIKPGEIFGESVLFGNQPRESKAVAAQLSKVIVLSRNAFLKSMQNTPQMGYTVAMQIEGRFKNIETRVEDLVFRNAQNRLACILLQLAQQFGQQEGDQIVLPMQLTHKELATLIGTSRPTVSLAINGLEEAKLIGKQGRHICINSIDSLANAIDQL
jgi:CRP/FNR family cyclic AMP-dependent transcriptional regulator